MAIPVLVSLPLRSMKEIPWGVLVVLWRLLFYLDPRIRSLAMAPKVKVTILAPEMYVAV